MKGLNVIVVGAGIGGLQSALALSKQGHNITIIETVKEFVEVGAGIRVPPNSNILSQSWSVDFSKIKKVKCNGLRFVDWKDQKLAGRFVL